MFSHPGVHTLSGVGVSSCDGDVTMSQQPEHKLVFGLWAHGLVARTCLSITYLQCSLDPSSCLDLTPMGMVAWVLLIFHLSTRHCPQVCLDKDWSAIVWQMPTCWLSLCLQGLSPSLWLMEGPDWVRGDLNYAVPECTSSWWLSLTFLWNYSTEVGEKYLSA